MNCDDVLHLITARIDGEISTADDDLLGVHLQSCATCRVTCDVLTRQDVELRRAFAEPRATAVAVADRVIADLQPRPRRLPWIAAGGIVGALAAALAMMAILRPPPSMSGPLAGDPRPLTPVDTPPLDPVDPVTVDPIDVPPSEPAGPDAGMAPVAVLAMATGPLHIDSQSCSSHATGTTDNALDSGATVRAADGADAEWHLRDGGVLRMQGGSQLFFQDSDLHVLRGRVWLRRPDTAPPMLITLAGHDVEFCGGVLDVQAGDADASAVAVLAGAATVRGGAAATAQHVARAVDVPAGHQVAMTAAGIGAPTPIDDGVLQTMWIHDLLSRKGRDDPELAERAAHLVERLRIDPDDARYARAIRACGFGAIAPLTTAVELPDEPPALPARDRLAGLLADVAGPWCIPALIDLIHDPDAEVRVAAARGLQRLTGQTFGRAPEDYREPTSVQSCDSAADPWRQWWQEHAPDYPRP